MTFNSILPEQIKEQIDSEASALSPVQLRRPSMSIEQFITEHARILARAEKDKDILVAAKFNWSRKELFDYQLKYLLLANGERTRASLKAPETRARFDEEMSRVKTDFVIIREVVSFIVKNGNDPKLSSRLKKRVSGRGKLAILINTLDLVAIISEHETLAQKICPGGVEINAPYLQRLSERALSLLRMKGLDVIEGVPCNLAVDRVRKLITLCINAREEIKQFAHAAFINDLDHYYRYYADEVRRSRKRLADHGQPETVSTGSERSLKI